MVFSSDVVRRRVGSDVGNVFGMARLRQSVARGLACPCSGAAKQREALQGALVCTGSPRVPAEYVAVHALMQDAAVSHTLHRPVKFACNGLSGP